MRHRGGVCTAAGECRGDRRTLTLHRTCSGPHSGERRHLPATGHLQPAVVPTPPWGVVECRGVSWSAHAAFPSRLHGCDCGRDACGVINVVFALLEKLREALGEDNIECQLMSVVRRMRASSCQRNKRRWDVFLGLCHPADTKKSRLGSAAVVACQAPWQMLDSVRCQDAGSVGLAGAKGPQRTTADFANEKTETEKIEFMHYGNMTPDRWDALNPVLREKTLCETEGQGSYVRQMESFPRNILT